MTIVYLIVSAISLAAVGIATWRREIKQGVDHEPNLLAIGKNLLIASVALVGSFTLLKIIAANIVDYWWFSEVGQAQMWITTHLAQWIHFGIAFTLTWVSLSASGWLAFRMAPTIPDKPVPTQRRGGGMTPTPEIFETWPVKTRYFRLASRLIKLACGIVIGLTTQGTLTSQTLKWQHLVQWGKIDPIFGLGNSFYDVVLPWLRTTLNLGLSVWVATAVFTGAIYVFLLYRTAGFTDYAQDRQADERKYIRGAMRHAALIVTLLLAGLAISTFLHRYSLVVTGNSKYIIGGGAGYLDVIANIPGLGWGALAIGLAAVTALIYSIKLFRHRFLVLIGSGLVVVWVVATIVNPWLRSIPYNTNPLDYERDYIGYQLDGARFAFGLDKIQDQGELGFTVRLTSEELRQSDATLQQARIADWNPLLAANNTLYEFQPAYHFTDVDVDRYRGAEYMVAVRELSQEQIPQGGQNWVNTRFRYTHGYGYTVASVSEVSNQGEPKMLVDRIPLNGPAEFAVTHPEIYFGELTNQYVFVGGNYKEFGYPSGTTIVETTYDGPAGIKLGGFGRRLVMAIALDDYRIAFSRLLTPESRVLFNRTLDQRTEKLAWFLTCDEDPYPVLGGEEVTWVRDCYTTSDSVPYSQEFDTNRYIRGTVKMTVGAWSGETQFYIVDPTDPIIQTWALVYPGFFKPIADMPALLRSHLRYPDDLLRAQADAYALYHTTSVEAFFNRQDQWERAKETTSVDGMALPADPRYSMMVIPGGGGLEFVSNVYFTPIGKQNAVAGMTARADPGVYGEIIAYQFSRDQAVKGFQMFETVVSQRLSQDITLWNQQGTRVQWGQIIGLVLPGKSGVSVIYIRSLYLQTSEAKMPTIERVVVMQGDQLANAPTLSGALRQLYGGSSTSTETTTPAGTKDELAAQAQQFYEAAEQCAGAGDWTCFGERMEMLGQVLEALQAQ